VAGCCECGDEPSGSGAAELVSLVILHIQIYLIFSFHFPFDIFPPIKICCYKVIKMKKINRPSCWVFRAYFENVASHVGQDIDFVFWDVTPR
jgi:hypothetical protein